MESTYQISNQPTGERRPSMSFAREEQDGNIKLKIEGSLSIYEAATLQQELCACLENDSDLELDLGGVTDCDAAGLQLLYATRKKAAEGKKRFHVTDVPQTVLDTLRRTGLNPDEVL
jgi:anti-anti-sigma factor